LRLAAQQREIEPAVAATRFAPEPGSRGFLRTRDGEDVVAPYSQCVIYCVIPRDSKDLFARMVECYRDNPDVTVIFDERAIPERRQERRNSATSLSRARRRTLVALPGSGNAELAREPEH
jgi:hypothetical protein